MGCEKGYTVRTRSASQVEVAATAAMSARDLLVVMGLSKTGISRVLGEGHLVRDGMALAAGSVVDAGDVVELAFGHSRVAGPTSDGPVRVLYEDEVLIAADKPASLLVHGDGTSSDTLTARVQGHLRREGSMAVPQAVQRLDVDTTGVTLLSLAEEFQPALDAAVADGGVRKRYLAVVRGRFPSGTKVIDRPLGRDRHDARRMRVSEGGRPAITWVRLLVELSGHSLVLLELGTGRRHQIRVHLASLGFPITGDALYGGERSDAGLMLHAYEEDLTHPLTGEALHVRTDWPERFSRWFRPVELPSDPLR
ncbi:MAG: RluA family pseudouridine synthase [Atopobiaceae bacterium]|nr:RluA family pseudouridine synthase [Atopobiaceae bacterium]MCI2174030.1 RluA family pseudouridine synthase [Atopobiaceae bacterium]MCI2207880.1 RluA family pseudouridine synthase [Atopobiaceae bacterium]